MSATAETTYSDLMAKWAPFVLRTAGRIARRYRLDVLDVQQDLNCQLLRLREKRDLQFSFGTWVSYVARGVEGGYWYQQRHSLKVISLSMPAAHADTNGNLADLSTILTDPTSPDPGEEAARRIEQ